jgi:hypothetical protein
MALVLSHETNIMRLQNTKLKHTSVVKVMNLPLKIGAVYGPTMLGASVAER